MYRFLQIRFFYKLKNYLKYEFDRNQTGFESGMGTSVNIQLLIDKIKKANKKDGDYCIFIDYKSAYNTIDKD